MPLSDSDERAADEVSVTNDSLDSVDLMAIRRGIRDVEFRFEIRIEALRPFHATGWFTKPTGSSTWLDHVSWIMDLAGIA
jgi:hypothetical protein